MLKISALENEYEASAFAHFRCVFIIVYDDTIFNIIFSYFIGIYAITELYAFLIF